ncbi:formimidoylglutamate deiminase [Hyphococcus flavus]|uniref:Formimidoylglutamate deiminase n=1 Tax=Hyphococcus flavus TaxID=1866326 RepID=A0AAF0CEG3_9PROT|nr:formimidoylglutamate deiminase [Hyphococcus flavus]WDI30119.1 formimidoylglutamate deiminase [Hyphococcus flavus]
MKSQTISAKTMLTANGWQSDMHLTIGEDGQIAAIKNGLAPNSTTVDVLLPAISNVHSHAFQRLLAGLTEYRTNAQDDFWSWRALMYKCMDYLQPDHFEIIAAMTQVEMLESGFSAVGEFHYVHHQPDGTPYDQPGEISNRVLQAALDTGIGLTHLPTLYMQGGLDGRALAGGQRRFGCTPEAFSALYSDIKKSFNGAPADFMLGGAAHSLRAVSSDGLSLLKDITEGAPTHIHIAEQTGEVDEVLSHLGARPVRWLLDNYDINSQWCLVHATHMDSSEINDLARSGAVAGVCPITEANLGDGIFEATQFADKGGAFAIGSDSNVRICAVEELRMLEYSQRLRDRRRVLLNDGNKSCGRRLLDMTATAGAQALGRSAGVISPGLIADLVALDQSTPVLCGLDKDAILDGWIFAGDSRCVSDLWAGGRHVVKQGRHIHREKIVPKFLSLMKEVRSAL